MRYPSCHLFNKCHYRECDNEFIKRADHQKYCCKEHSRKEANARCVEKGKYKSYHERTYKPVDRSDTAQACVICGGDVFNKKLLRTPLCSSTCRAKRRTEVRERENWLNRNSCSLAFNNRISSLKQGAKARSIPFNLTKLPACPTHCPVLGTEFYSNGRDTWASLDRIDNTKGYQDDNVWWISMRANMIKGHASPQELKKLVEALDKLCDP